MNTHSFLLRSITLIGSLLLTLSAQAYAPEPVPSMACGSCSTQISAVQGTGPSSPLIPEGADTSAEIVVEAIVTANAPDRLKGFFIQESRANEDGDFRTSEGLFVDGAQPGLQPGDRVRIRGTVREFYGQTQLMPEDIRVCGKNALHEVPATTPLKKVKLQDLEHYEGMLVNFSGVNRLTVTRNYSFNFDAYRNNMDVSLGDPLFKPTQLHPPLSHGAIELADANDRNRITIITDEAKQSDGQISYYPALGPYVHYIRVGDRIEDLTAVVLYRYGRYELLPTEDIGTYAFNHDFSDREGWPSPHQQAELRIASFNVLNYFNTWLPGHKDNPLGVNRGAQSLNEFVLQRDKIVEAITRIDADIIGLMELENNGFGPGSAIDDLVDTLNHRLPFSERYAAVRGADNIGGDAITVGLVYKPERVKLHGWMQILPMPEQSFTLTSTDGETVDLVKSMRPSVMQAFADNDTGQVISVVVNHFKSKGSMCYEDYMEYADEQGRVPLDGTKIKKGSKPTSPHYQDDLQGSCNELRVAATKHLGDYLGKSGYLHGDNLLLLIGDFNAYGQEDPIRLLTRGKRMKRPVATSTHTRVNCQDVPYSILYSGYGLANLASLNHGENSFSYSYGGELGALDHAIGSKALAGSVSHVEEWHINSTENSLFEYASKYSGDLPKDRGPFSSSDHDPLIVDIDWRRASHKLNNQRTGR